MKTLELLNVYIDILSCMVDMNLIINSLDDSNIDMKIFDFFNDYRSVDKNKIYSRINNNISSGKIDRIIKCSDFLSSVYNNYYVSNLDDLATLILTEWNNNKEYSDEIIKNVLRSVDFKIKHFDSPRVSLVKIYKDMVSNDMIKDPNLAIGTSYESLYTKLPSDSSCYEYNLKVISNPMIDWSIYRNGQNPLGHYCLLYNNSKNDSEKKYYHDLIITAISSSCSLFNNKFAWHVYSKKTEETINYYYLTESDKKIHSIKDIEFIKEIHDLLLTDKLFNHQMELYTEKNNDADLIINKLKAKIR